MNWMQRICAFFDKWKALHRILSVMASVALTRAFLIEAEDRTIDWTDMIGYSVAMAMTYSPTIIVKVIDAIVAVRTGKEVESADVK